MEEITVFLDTNGFIQLRDLKDVAWRELFPEAKRVSIVVARAVIEELDHHKVSTNARRRDRARAALKKIDEATTAPSRMIEIRQKPIQITLTVPRRIKIDWEELSDLDKGTPDDRLVAEAISYSRDAILISHDSGPRISGRDVGLSAYAPPESWLLPIEQTDDQRRIRTLEGQLEQALTKSPSLSIAFPQAEEQQIKLYRYRLPELRQNEIDALAYAYINDNPKRDLKVVIYPFGDPPGGGPGFSQADFVRYSAAYSSFRDEVHLYFKKLHEKLAHVAGVPELWFDVHNTGAGSASKLVVKIAAEGDFGLVADGDRTDVAGSLDLPAPPTPKMESQERLRGLTSGLFKPPVHPQFPTDPTRMRWIERPLTGEDCGTFGCDDFRPRETSHHRIFLWPRTLPSKGTIRVTASAEHTPAVSETSAVVIKDKMASWSHPDVLQMLPEEVRAKLKAIAQTGE